MSLVRVRRAAQLTLPAEIRGALNVKEGDYLEVSVTKDGVLLKPVAVVARAHAWRQIESAVAKVRDRKPSRGGVRKEEQAIAREVKRMRQVHA